MIDSLKIQKVQKILLQDWDPFCVGDNPHLADEYDSFIADIVYLLDKHCSSKELNQHLAGIEKKLHAPLHSERRAKVVMALQSIT